jgi:hypothetical protein
VPITRSQKHNMEASRDGGATEQTSPPESASVNKEPARPDTRDTISARAYERFVSRGQVHGHDQADWFEAERETQQSKSE